MPPTIQQPENFSSEKACPYCAETVKAAAIKCKHCGSALDEKPQKTDTLPTIELTAAPAHKRFCAFFLDGIIIGILSFLPYSVLSAKTADLPSMVEKAYSNVYGYSHPGAEGKPYDVMFLLTLLLPLSYMLLKDARGGSICKKLYKLKIVNLRTANPATALDSLKRNIVRPSYLIVYMVVVFAISANPDLWTINNHGPIMTEDAILIRNIAISALYFVSLIVCSTMVLFSSSGRHLGDIVGATVVVEIEPRKSQSEIATF